MPVIRHLQKEGLAVGTPVCKTSRAMVFAMLGNSPDHILIQRGFRQYGQMHVDRSDQERHVRRPRGDQRREPGLLPALQPPLSDRLLQRFRKRQTTVAGDQLPESVRQVGDRRKNC